MVRLLSNLYSNLNKPKISLEAALHVLPVSAEDAKGGIGLVQFREMLGSLTRLVDEAIEARKNETDIPEPPMIEEPK